MIRLAVCGTKDINIGGSGLAIINYASLSSLFKFIDPIKHSLSSLGSLASTLNNVEKMCVKNGYFLQTWSLLDFSQKKVKVLDIIVRGKG